MKKELTVNAGGQVNQSNVTTVTNTEIKKEPPSIEVGPVKVSHDNMWISVGVVAVMIIVYVVFRHFKRNKK